MQFQKSKLPVKLILTVARQAPLSVGFSRQEYWSGLPGDLQEIFLTQGSNLALPQCRQILYHLSEPPGKPPKMKIAQIFLKGKNKIVGVILSNFKSSCKDAVIKRVCYQ